MRDDARDSGTSPMDEAAIVSLAATARRRLADLLTAAAGAGPTDDQPRGDAGDRVAGDDARQALESVHATIQHLIVRATAAGHGSAHPKLEQALTALRQAAIEAAEAAHLLSPPGSDDAEVDRNSTDTGSPPA